MSWTERADQSRNSMLVAFDGATHLHTIAIGGKAQFRLGIGPLLAGTGRVPPPEPSRCSGVWIAPEPAT